VLKISPEIPNGTLIYIKALISSDGYEYWDHTFSIRIGEGFISAVDNVEMESIVLAVYPNPVSEEIVFSLQSSVFSMSMPE